MQIEELRERARQERVERADELRKVDLISAITDRQNA